jgi:uncharacterized protein YggU (UPF0235/DUF167 family)
MFIKNFLFKLSIQTQYLIDTLIYKTNSSIRIVKGKKERLKGYTIHQTTDIIDLTVDVDDKRLS